MKAFCKYTKLNINILQVSRFFLLGLPINVHVSYTFFFMGFRQHKKLWMKLLYECEMRCESWVAMRNEDALQTRWNSKSKTFVDSYTALKSRWSNKIKKPSLPFDIAKQLWLIADTR